MRVRLAVGAMLETAVDLLVGIRASDPLREEVRQEIDAMCLRFAQHEAWQEGPSVAEGLRQLEALKVAATSAVMEECPEDPAALGASLREALAPFLTASPYGMRHCLRGEGPSTDGKRMIPVQGVVAATSAGEDTSLSLALAELEQGKSLSPGGRYALCCLMSSAAVGAEEFRARRKPGKGTGGAPLHAPWAAHDMVVYCLDLWERVAPGRASRTPGSPFVQFVSCVFALATGEEPSDHGRVIREVLRKWRARQRPVAPGRPPKPHE